jgi:Recombinase
MSRAVFEASIGRARVRGVGKQGVAAAEAAFARLELWREIKFCVWVLLTLWALFQEGSVVKFVAYHVVEATERGHSTVRVCRDGVEKFIGAADGRLMKEIVEHFSDHGRYLFFKDAVRTARTHQAKLLVSGINLEEVMPDFLNFQENFCIVDIPAMKRGQLRQLLQLKPPKKRTRREGSNHSETTKVGLEKAKLQGVALGNPSARALQPKASYAASAAAEEFRAKLRIRILEHHREGLSLREIADRLNDGRIPSARGRSWHASSVRKILAEAKEDTK